MSGTAALATVTNTLQFMLAQMTSKNNVTTKPPSVVSSDNGSHLNLFLYNTLIDTAFSNTPIPGKIKNGESGAPPIALTLKYLVTAYEGDSEQDISEYQLMGEAMRVFHDHSILGKTDIEGVLPDSNLDDQIENIRITHDPVTLDDMSKLWSSFQSEYRLSTGYEVSVVFIEGKRSSKTPLPVLTRGKEDSGIDAQANLIPPYPTLTDLIVPNQQPGIEIDSELILQGYHLQNDTVIIRFYHPHLDEPIDVPPVDVNDHEISLTIPDSPDQWRAGIYQLEVLVSETDTEPRITNQLALPVVPKIKSPPVVVVNGNITTLTISCSPKVDPKQKVYLLFGSRQIPYKTSDTTLTDSLEFTIDNVSSGEYYIRLRIDGVDSLLVADRTAQPPQFDAIAKVVIP